MINRTRINYTAKHEAEIWDARQRRESQNTTRCVFGRPSPSIFGQLVPSGGIRTSPRRGLRLALNKVKAQSPDRLLTAIIGHLLLSLNKIPLSIAVTNSTF